MTRFIVGFVVTVLVVLAALGLWLGVTGWGAKKTTDALRQEVQLAAAEGAEGQISEAVARWPTITEQASELDSTFNSVPWSWVADFPVVGESVAALGKISQATARTLDAASFEWLDDPEAVQGVDVPLLEESAASLDAMYQVAQSEVAQVQAINTDEVVSALRGQVDNARQQYLDLAKGLDVASGAANALPTVLGYKGERTWLVILQNTSEARGTGGMIGAYSIPKVKKGKVDPLVSDSNNSLTNEKISTRGIPADTRRLWAGDMAYMWGLNVDRHFPFAARLVPRTLPAGSPQIDDVVSLDPAAVAALLEVTGPVKSRGVTVTSENAEEFFTSKVYEQFPVTSEKDAVVVEMLEKVLAKLSDSAFDLAQLWTVLGPLAEQERVLIASQDKDVQTQLERMPTAGVVPTDPGPWATVAVNDSAGSKMDAFVKVKVRYDSASLCPTDSGTSRIMITAENNAPRNLPEYTSQRIDKGGGPEGSTKIDLGVYAPVGSDLQSVVVDGKSDGAIWGTSRNHPVWKRGLVLNRGQTRSVELTFDEPYWPDVTPVLQPQPMVQDMEVSVVKPSDC